MNNNSIINNNNINKYYNSIKINIKNYLKNK